MTQMTGKRGWLVSREWESHPIHLIIKILLCWDHSLVSIHMKFKYLHFFSPIQRSLSKFPCHPNFLVTQISLSPTFQSCFSQDPDHPAKPLARGHESVHICMSGHLSFQAKWITRCNAWSSAHREDFPSLLSYRDVPEMGCTTAVNHFSGLPVYYAKPSIHQALVFSSVVWS